MSTDTKPVTEPKLKIESWDDIKNALTIARGGDPDAIQAITSFIDFKSNIERSNFPDTKTTLCIAQLTGYGKANYPSDDWDPFNLVADCLAVAFMARKGEKSNQFVEITRQTPSLADLQTIREGSPRSTMDKLLGRGKTE